VYRCTVCWGVEHQCWVGQCRQIMDPPEKRRKGCKSTLCIGVQSAEVLSTSAGWASADRLWIHLQKEWRVVEYIVYRCTVCWAVEHQCWVGQCRQIVDPPTKQVRDVRVYCVQVYSLPRSWAPVLGGPMQTGYGFTYKRRKGCKSTLCTGVQSAELLSTSVGWASADRLWIHLQNK
jgi:hypothetical protein